MKKFALFFLAAVCAIGLTGCGNSETESQKSYTETFSAADIDLSVARAIQIRSGTTGYTVLLTEQDDMETVISAVTPLFGQDPVSSRGTYGWTYNFTFYETDAPGENDIPLLFFGLHIFGEKAYITHGVYEKADSHTYQAMYTVDLSAAEALAAVCDRYQP